MTARDPFIVFDWYFSDSSRSDGARHHALKERPTETKQLMTLVNADSMVHFALWSQLPDGHPVRDLWMETNTDLLATVYLAYGGFFRQALTAIRSWFEIAVHGVYFAGHYGQATGRYELWRKGQRDAPVNMRNISASLAGRTTSKGPPIAERQILNRLEPVYASLSLHAHGRGLDEFDLQDGRDNVPRYLPKSFDVWFGMVFEAVDAVYFLYASYFMKQISAYLLSSPPELERAKALCNELDGKLPGYCAIIGGL